MNTLHGIRSQTQNTNIQHHKAGGTTDTMQPQRKHTHSRATTRALLLASVAVLMLVSATVQAQEVPDVMPYQGLLTGTNGEAVSGDASFTFRLYNAPDAATPVWLETIQDVAVKNGVFYVYLGMQTPVWDYITAGGPMWLGIEVNGDGEALPRQEVGSVPFAILAGNALQLGGVDAGEFLTREEIIQLIEERLQNVAVNPYILGASADETTGRTQYTDNNNTTWYGMKGAHYMCRDSYPGTPTAHMCSTNEVMRALAAGDFDANNAANIDEVDTWTISDVTEVNNGRHIQDTLGTTCQNFAYASGDVANGTRLTIDLDYTSIGNEGQITSDVFRVARDINCAQSYKVMCCR